MVQLLSAYRVVLLQQPYVYKNICIYDLLEVKTFRLSHKLSVESVLYDIWLFYINIVSDYRVILLLF